MLFGLLALSSLLILGLPATTGSLLSLNARHGEQDTGGNLRLPSAPLESAGAVEGMESSQSR